jgi:DNA-binding response OmpR family regulator
MASPRVPGTILLIGDQDAVQATHAEGLRLQDYQVLTAATGVAAEAIGQHLGLDSLALVILDLSQVREGKTLVQRWGGQAPQLPFMLISDGPMPDRLDPPVVWWLVKPLTGDTLLMAVYDILES